MNETPVHERVSVEDLKDHHCRWPLGEVGTATFGHCGKPKFAGPYCFEHAKRAYPLMVTGRSPRGRNALRKDQKR
jgi:GcrA cell cycle regulator